MGPPHQQEEVQMNYCALAQIAAEVLSGLGGDRRGHGLLSAIFEFGADAASNLDMRAGFDSLAEGVHLSASIECRSEAAEAFERAASFFQRAGREDLARLAGAAREAVLEDLAGSRLEAALLRIL
jgi:hypothetical protein